MLEAIPRSTAYSTLKATTFKRHAIETFYYPESNSPGHKKKGINFLLRKLGEDYFSYFKYKFQCKYIIDVTLIKNYLFT